MRVLFFTGTGNSRFAAQRIAEKLSCEVTDLRPQIKNDVQEPVRDEDVVFVTPTYAWKMPAVLEEWIKKADLAEVKRAWFVMTCGDSVGDACEFNRRLCLRKEIEYMGTLPVVMPENYVAMFNTPGKAEARIIVGKAVPVLDRAAGRILKGEKFDPLRVTIVHHALTRLMSPAFSKFFIKGEAFSVDDDCIGCGKCVERCVMNNIAMFEGKPEWGDDCIHCMACICYCPKEAIQYGTATENRQRYTFEGLDYKKK